MVIGTFEFDIHSLGQAPLPCLPLSKSDVALSGKLYVYKIYSFKILIVINIFIQSIINNNSIGIDDVNDIESILNLDGRNFNHYKLLIDRAKYNRSLNINILI